MSTKQILVNPVLLPVAYSGLVAYASLDLSYRVPPLKSIVGCYTSFVLMDIRGNSITFTSISLAKDAKVVIKKMAYSKKD